MTRQLLVALFFVIFTVKGADAELVERYVPGVDYTVIQNTQNTKNLVTVMEFFSYGCPHCYELEPYVEKWLSQKPKAVKFERVPAQWNPSFKLLGQMYYISRKLGMGTPFDQKIFEYLQVQRKSVKTEAQAKTFFESLGVSATAYDQAASSPEVAQNMKMADALLKQYQITGVPGFVVNQKYFTNVSMAGSPAELFNVVNFLLSKH